MRPFLLALALAMSASAAAQQPASADLRQRITDYRKAHDVEIVRELNDFLAIPNLASDKANIRRNAQHLLGMIGSAGCRRDCSSRRAVGRPPCTAS